MKIKFNKTGAERKALVTAIGEILEVKPKYMGMPSANYEVDYFTIDKQGTLEFDDSADSEEIENLLEKLAEKGFIAEPKENIEVEETSEQEEDLGLTIAMPVDSVAVGNLTNLLEAKGRLIKKALGVEDIRIEIEEEKVLFPWFKNIPDEEHYNAYLYFITAICRLSKESKRISAKEREVSNEKYTFRCFLLRLGMIGDKYKAIRKILLQNLEGSAAFKTGAKKEVASDEISE